MRSVGRVLRDVGNANKRPRKRSELRNAKKKWADGWKQLRKGKTAAAVESHLVAANRRGDGNPRRRLQPHMFTKQLMASIYSPERV